MLLHADLFILGGSRTTGKLSRTRSRLGGHRWKSGETQSRRVDRSPRSPFPSSRPTGNYSIRGHRDLSLAWKQEGVQSPVRGRMHRVDTDGLTLSSRQVKCLT